VNVSVYLFLIARFKKNGSLQSYTFYIYFLVFFFVASVAFLLLDAMDRYMGRPEKGNLPYYTFPCYAMISGLCGLAVAFLILQALTRLAKENEFQLVKWSLVIIGFSLFMVMIRKPFSEAMAYSNPIAVNTTVNVKSASIQLQPLASADSGRFRIATPAAYSDSLQFDTYEGIVDIYNRKTGRSFNKQMSCRDNVDFYYSALADKKYLVVLGHAKPVNACSSLLIFDDKGICLFEDGLKDYPVSLWTDGHNKIALEYAEGGKRYFRVD
jgi:hypothetical protein